MRTHTVSSLNSKVKPMVGIVWQRFTEWLSKWLAQVRNVTWEYRIKSTVGPSEKLIWILDENGSSPPMRDCTYMGGSRDAGFWLLLRSRAWSKDSRKGNLYWKVISRKWNGIQGKTKEGRKKDSWICLASWIGIWSSILPVTLGNPQNTLPNCPPEEWKKHFTTFSHFLWSRFTSWVANSLKIPNYACKNGHLQCLRETLKQKASSPGWQPGAVSSHC